MSSQSYTNKIRTLAEASLTKAQYPGNVVSENKLSVTINCNPNFNRLTYPYICPCVPNNRGTR